MKPNGLICQLYPVPTARVIPRQLFFFLRRNMHPASPSSARSSFHPSVPPTATSSRPRRPGSRHRSIRSSSVAPRATVRIAPAFLTLLRLFFLLLFLLVLAGGAATAPTLRVGQRAVAASTRTAAATSAWLWHRPAGELRLRQLHAIRYQPTNLLPLAVVWV